MGFIGFVLFLIWWDLAGNKSLFLLWFCFIDLLLIVCLMVLFLTLLTAAKENVKEKEESTERPGQTECKVSLLLLLNSFYLSVYWWTCISCLIFFFVNGFTGMSSHLCVPRVIFVIISVSVCCSNRISFTWSWRNMWFLIFGWSEEMWLELDLDLQVIARLIN